jgi:hypothetical protein
VALITKLLRKVVVFQRIVEYQTAWEDIKNQYIQTPILINPKWEVKFHVHINAFWLAVGAILV